MIEAYFSAVGSLFDSFSKADTMETTAINNQLSLELAKIKYAACIEAIKDDDKELLRELQCN